MKEEKFPHTRGWVLRLRLWRSDPRERTGVGYVRTAGGEDDG